jgi:Fe-S-cluster containining protein
MSEKPFYTEGLRFSCTRCSSCCRYEEGFVFLSRKDADLLAGELCLGYTEFVEAYCRWVPCLEGGMERLSLKEKSNRDCVFWTASASGETRGGCRVYKVRPLQCRTFPFWRPVLVSAESWKWTAGTCPGMGKGVLYSMDYIKTCLASQEADPAVVRKT